MKRFLIVIGTRPEAIKMAPVVLNLRKMPGTSVMLCVTGQHQEMLTDALKAFDLCPDKDLKVMRSGQTLSDLASKVLQGVSETITDWSPHCVLVHGDTTTAMAASLASFHAKIPLAHVEAGLRTHDLRQPWPEEANRRICDLVANRHFAPTEKARDNLLAEGISLSSIEVTGNTVIDALLMTQARLLSDALLLSKCNKIFEFLDRKINTVLVTGHRRENFGDGIQSICRALLRIASRSDVQVVYPLHPNPNVDSPVRHALGGQKNIHLISPLDYVSFVALMMRSTLILTDSGGIQEEAPSLGKPVLVMRDVTERPEALEAGTIRLVGTNESQIVKSVSMLLDSQEEREAMAQAVNPFGDGLASQRIALSCIRSAND